MRRSGGGVTGLGGILWWIGLAAVALVVFPVVAYLAVRIIRSLAVVQSAAQGIRSSLSDVGSGVPPAMQALDTVATRCERLAREVKV